VHEAHRHPFLERLAQIYLMKLRYKNFGSCRAAAAWRQLFIVAYFPWLAKYRVFDKERLEEAKKAAVARRLEELGLDRDGGLEARLMNQVRSRPLAGEIGELAKITHQEVGGAVAGVANIVAPDKFYYDGGENAVGRNSAMVNGGLGSVKETGDDASDYSV